MPLGHTNLPALNPNVLRRVLALLLWRASVGFVLLCGMAWHAVNGRIALVAMSHGKTPAVSVALVECDARDAEATSAEAVKQGAVHGEASTTNRLTRAKIEGEKAQDVSSRVLLSTESHIASSEVVFSTKSNVIFCASAFGLTVLRKAF